MPYSEHHQMAKGKLESTQTKKTNCSTDLAFVPDNEFVELVWENGQILMQGQSSRTRKSPSCTGFPSHTSKAQEKDGGDAVTPNIGRFGTMDSVLNDFSSLGTIGRIGLDQDDDIVRWLNYPLDDSLQHDYCSEFFSELSGVNLNALSEQNNPVPIDKNSSYGQIVSDSHMVSMHRGANPEQGNASKIVRVGPEPTRPRSNQLCSSPLQQSHRSRISDITSSNSNNAHQAPYGNSCQNLNSTGGPPNTKMQKQDPRPTRPPLQPSNNTGLMNFSHFLRPAALVKANLRSTDATAGLAIPSIDRFRSNDKVSAASISKPGESMMVESASGSISVTGYQSQSISMPGKVDVKPSMGKPLKEPLSAEKSEAICQEDAFHDNKSPDQVLGRTSSFTASTAIARPTNEKATKPVVASSSICSGSSAGGASNNPKHVLKRKSQDAEESEYPSEDVEEESVGVMKSATSRRGTGPKRSRAAEVHNLSERRRRDRINEKMRALQELIPNCNKVDKASMLDEAIEYLKTLQLQLQIMSMGTGFCMPPMMLPTGLQHIHAPHMTHFSPMGVGMGMGMGMGLGFGMGMLDMSSGSSGCPLIQMPPMHGQQFACPPMAGSNLQIFGLHGQGLPMSMPQPPFVPLSGGPSTKSISLPVVTGAATPVEVPDSALPSSSKDPIENINTQMMAKTSAECSQNQTSNQATKEGFEQSAMVQRNDRTPHVSGN